MFFTSSRDRCKYTTFWADWIVCIERQTTQKTRYTYIKGKLIYSIAISIMYSYFVEDQKKSQRIIDRNFFIKQSSRVKPFNFIEKAHLCWYF